MPPEPTERERANRKAPLPAGHLIVPAVLRGIRGWLKAGEGRVSETIGAVDLKNARRLPRRSADAGAVDCGDGPALRD